MPTYLYGEGLYSQQYRQELDKLRLKRTVAPASQPLTNAQVKPHLTIASGNTDHDDYIDDLIEAAVEKFEEDTASAIITQTWTQKFPVLQDGLKLHRGPNTAISSITYYDSANASQTLASSNYSFDDTTNEIRLAAAQTWPATYERYDAVTVTFTCGYADADAVPTNIKHALKLLIGFWFDGDRGDNPTPPKLQSYYNLIANLQRSSYP